MDYFFATTFDDAPITIAIDEDLCLALVVVGADENAWSGAMDLEEAFLLKDEAEIFDLDEVWALLAAIRESAWNDTPGVIRTAACALLEG